MKSKNIVLMTIIFVVVMVLVFILPNRINNDNGQDDSKATLKNNSLNKGYSGDDFEEVYLAGGCFWGVEAYMEMVNGVIDVTSGYANGNTENPSYEDVLYKGTEHAETVHVKYDPKVTDLQSILLYYFKVIDPTSINKQGNDRGSQYRTGIYYVNDDQLDIIEKVIEKEQKNHKKEIVVEVEPIDGYYLAEEYHQDYLEKNPNGYCHIDLGLAQEDINREDLYFDLDSLNPVDENLYTKPSEEQIKEKLNKDEYNIIKEGGTERAFTHEYNGLDKKGIYVDKVTGEPLFSSEDKYDSGSGWPSFTKPIDKEVIRNNEDKSLGMNRVEVRSRVGDTHLGHLFDDGPRDAGGQRYCINGASLRFVPYEAMEEEGYGYLMDIFN